MKLADVGHEIFQYVDGVLFQAGGDFDEVERDVDGIGFGTVGDEAAFLARNDAACGQKSVGIGFVAPSDGVHVVVLPEVVEIVEFVCTLKRLVGIGVESVKATRPGMAGVVFLSDLRDEPDQARFFFLALFKDFVIVGRIGGIGWKKEFLAKVFDDETFAVCAQDDAFQACVVV